MSAPLFTLKDDRLFGPGLDDEGVPRLRFDRADAQGIYNAGRASVGESGPGDNDFTFKPHKDTREDGTIPPKYFGQGCAVIGILCNNPKIRFADGRVTLVAWDELKETT